MTGRIMALHLISSMAIICSEQPINGR